MLITVRNSINLITNIDIVTYNYGIIKKAKININMFEYRKVKILNYLKYYFNFEIIKFIYAITYIRLVHNNCFIKLELNLMFVKMYNLNLVKIKYFYYLPRSPLLKDVKKLST